MHSRVVVPLTILALCVASAPSWAKRRENAKKNQNGVPVISVSSRLVVLDVVVLHQKKPVCGLKQRDFEITENRQAQSIGFFESHCGKAVNGADDEAMKPPPLPPDTYDNLPVSRVTDSVTVLLLDGLNTEAWDSQYLRLQMIQYLKNLPAGQRIAIFALGSQLRMLQGFTTNSGLLTAAVKSGRFTPAASLRPSSGQQAAEQQELDTLTNAGVPEVTIARLRNFMGESDTEETGMRVGMTLDALQQLARYLSGIPGRKNLVWFSGSFPVEFYSDVETPTGQTFSVVTGSFQDELERTASLLAQARVAVYPVDVRGVLVEPLFDASQQAIYGEFNGTVGNMPTFAHQGMVADLQRIEEHGTMNMLAKDTGGRAVYDSNALKEAVADAMSDGQNYYTIAYVPQNGKFDGRWRRIDVSVAKKPEKGRYVLLYRHGYFATNNRPAQPRGNKLVSEEFAAAMSDGVPASSQILFKARVVSPGPNPPTGPIQGRAQNLKNRAARYVIDYAVSLRHIGLALSPDGARIGKVVVEALAYNDDGAIVNWQSNVDAVQLAPSKWNLYAEDGLQIHELLDLPKGNIHLRLGIYDPATGNVGTMEIPLKVGMEQTAAAATAKR